MTSPATSPVATATDDDSLIRMRGIKKVFVTDEVETHALTEVHLDVQQGEFVAISGPSGCGKTTLLSILGLLDATTEGEYRSPASRSSDLSPAERARVRNRQIGFIFQAFNLIGDLTVYENVELPLTYRTGDAALDPAERRRRVDGRARARRHVASHEALSRAALRRSAAACRRRARRGRRAGHPPRRRADG